MIPSRGLHALKSIAPHVRIQTRNISIARTIPSRSQLRVATPFITQPSIIATTAIASAKFRRNASTAPTSQPETITNTSPLPNIDTLTLDDIDFSTPGVPTQEGIGYLKEIGLDFGWGPTAIIEWTIEHLHISAGLPWWGSIAVAAALFRVLTFPLFLRSAHSAAKQNALHSIFDPINERLKQFQKEGNMAAAQAETQKLMAARRKAGIGLTDMLIPAVVQGVVGFCSFRLLRAMSVLPVPGLRDGGFSWLTDLTVPDGFLIVPTFLAITTHVMIRLGGETGSSTTMNPTMQKLLFWGMPTLIFAVTIFQPGALCVWFGVSTFMALLQTFVLQSNSTRRIFGLPPVYKKPKSAQPTGNTFVGPQPSQGYTRPTYQAPNLRRSKNESKIIDTTLAEPKGATPKSSNTTSKKTSLLTQMTSSVTDTVKNYNAENKEKRLKQLETKRKEDAIRQAFERRRQS
ncbi:hypothetical protein AMS68_007477 [Peltaster fructicola]|uniref:Membrane insertase YidC/Oxa/ALB C-terminal domain-containing protein n=1 Tax=Peltaster fructicola TaxID=286661 RepID=A0A6H0Y5U0_9PEZI|nr:hypothetical protein AMS68_007477 [Peltaster fructicola]